MRPFVYLRLLGRLRPKRRTGPAGQAPPPQGTLRQAPLSSDKPWRSALVLDGPFAAVVVRLPAGWLAVDFGLHVLLLGLAAVANYRWTTFRILLRCCAEEMVLRIDFVLVRHDFHYQRRTGLAVFRELAGRQEQAGRAVAQDIGDRKSTRLNSSH